jgi:hypothetical protein
MDNTEARAMFIRLLLDKVREDRYPSSTQLDIIEQMIPAEWLPDYLEVLWEKVQDDRFPSIPMLNRIARLVEAVPA